VSNTRPVQERFKPAVFSLRSAFQTLATLHHWHALRTHALTQYDWVCTRRSRRSEQYGRPIPWWPYALTQLVDQLVPPTAEVLELGSGASTLWWAQRGNQVTAVENDESWASRVQEDSYLQPGKVNLHLIHGTRVTIPNELMSKKYDVITVDNIGDRISVVSKAIPLLRIGGIIVLDNSDQSDYSEAARILTSANFEQIEFYGLGPINAYAWTASLFVRSDRFTPRGRPLTKRTITY